MTGPTRRPTRPRVTRPHLARLRPARLGAMFAALCLGLAGCASIPVSSIPQQIDLQGSGAATSTGANPPQRNDSPINIVRGFVGSGDPADDHAAARGYLSGPAKSAWNMNPANTPITIINDVFGTAPVSDVPVAGSIAGVVLHAQVIGRLNPDGSFTPIAPTASADYQVTMHVQRQSDGQWRISDPPSEPLITQSDFGKYYRQVNVYYFDPSQQILVPDPRYVVADPQSGMPGRIVELLLGPPSAALTGAVVNEIPAGAALKTNVTESQDGTIVINLKAVPDLPSSTKQLMIAQIVRSLQSYGSTVVVQSEGVPLVPGHQNWRVADLPQYAPYAGPNQTGLVVAKNKVLTLAEGNPVAGPAGSGGYNVVSAAQSMDGSELATVTQEPGGQVLRVGKLGSPADPVKDLVAQQFTRPTWTPGDSAGDPSRTLWTVEDGTVIRVVNNAQGAWVTSPVDASELAAYGPITDLRLSRDGVRVAVIAGGHLLVGAVVQDGSSAAIKQVVCLQPGSITSAVRVDWLRQDLLVVATTQADAPVASVTVDGQLMQTYNPANLNPQVTALAATDSQPVLVVDSAGIWLSTGSSEVWQQAPHNLGAGAIPFYPG